VGEGFHRAVGVLLLERQHARLGVANAARVGLLQ
jgi:hypothetical protein